MRFKGGNNTTPDCSKFLHTLKLILTNQLLQPSDLGNNDVDCAEFLLVKKDIETKKPAVFPRLPYSMQYVNLHKELCDNEISARMHVIVKLGRPQS